MPWKNRHLQDHPLAERTPRKHDRPEKLLHLDFLGEEINTISRCRMAKDKAGTCRSCNSKRCRRPSSSDTKMYAVYHFHGDLPHLLRRRWRAIQPLVQPVCRSASIKDVIESFGLPHTEIDRITCNGQVTDFSQRVEANQHFDLYPIPSPWDILTPTLLRPTPLPDIRFMVDVNVGRLARYLRMAGFDTLYNASWDDQKILQEMQTDRRILLTRDLDLLKRKQVEFGRYIRAITPVDQLREILGLFGREVSANSFTRCLECNTPLQPVEKQDILERLEPLTIRYYTTFRICPCCDKIYWPGSHVDKMQRSLRQAGDAN